MLEGRNALIEAVQHTDISFFGPLYDHSLRLLQHANPQLDPEQARMMAFKATVENPVIQRAGVNNVINAYKEQVHGTQHYSPGARYVLEKHIRELELKNE